MPFGTYLHVCAFRMLAVRLNSAFAVAALILIAVAEVVGAIVAVFVVVVAFAVAVVVVVVWTSMVDVQAWLMRSAVGASKAQ